MIGSLCPRTLRELIDYLSILGSEIDEVGMEIIMDYLLGQIGYFDDGTQGVTGGKLLGEILQEITHHLPAKANLHIKGVDCSIRMTGLDKDRAKWVSRVELNLYKIDGSCLRCGKIGHVIANCQLLPAKNSEASTKVTTFAERILDTAKAKVPRNEVSKRSAPESNCPQMQENETMTMAASSRST